MELHLLSSIAKLPLMMLAADAAGSTAFASHLESRVSEMCALTDFLAADSVLLQ